MKTQDPIIQQINDALKDRNMSVTDLAVVLELPKDRVYKWTQGKGAPRIDDRIKVEEWLNGKDFQNSNEDKYSGPKPPGALEKDDILRILANLSESHKNLTAAHKEISESNNKLADNEKMILRRIPVTEGVREETLSNELATILGIRELIIEMYAKENKTSEQEAEAVLGTKVVAAKKRVHKRGTPSDAGT